MLSMYFTLHAVQKMLKFVQYKVIVYFTSIRMLVAADRTEAFWNFRDDLSEGEVNGNKRKSFLVLEYNE